MKGAMLWVAVVAASVATFAIKLVGHLLPRRVLAKPQVARVAVSDADPAGWVGFEVEP